MYTVKGYKKNKEAYASILHSIDYQRRMCRSQIIHERHILQFFYFIKYWNKGIKQEKYRETYHDSRNRKIADA